MYAHVRFYLHSPLVLAVMSAAALPATSSSARAAMIHAYELNGSFADSMGGPSLQTFQGGSVGATGFSFAGGEGLRLASWTSGTGTSDNYSIEMYFKLTNTEGWQKLIDFTNGITDRGLYNNNGSIIFTGSTGFASGAFFSDQMTHLVLTRNGATDQVGVYVNGVSRLNFVDAGDNAVSSVPSNVIRFFRDDSIEHAAGFIDYLRIYDSALSPTQVSSAFDNRSSSVTAVPEPASLTMLGIGALTMMGRYGWRRGKAGARAATQS